MLPTVSVAYRLALSPSLAPSTASIVGGMTLLVWQTVSMEYLAPSVMEAPGVMLMGVVVRVGEAYDGGLDSWGWDRALGDLWKTTVLFLWSLHMYISADDDISLMLIGYCGRSCIQRR